MSVEDQFDILCHYGTPRHSGRYPWGSGDNPYQRSQNFLSQVNELRKKGMSETDIVTALDLKSTNELRALKSIANNERKTYQLNMIHKLKEKGMSNVAIAKRLDINESQVRALLASETKAKSTSLDATTDILRKALKESKYVDVGSGVSRYLGVSDTTLSTACEVLKKEGYEVKTFDIRQVTTGNITHAKAIVPEGTTLSDIYANLDEVNMPTGYVSREDGEAFYIHRPVKISRDRVQVRYASDDENSGTLRDGTIELRRGVKDIDLGNSRYAQVRIAMDNGMYMKGMAVYNDHMPDGIDIVFNSNKKPGSPEDKVFKKMKDDPDNPFGSLVWRQNDWVDEKGEKHEGALNILKEEGAWQDWKKSIASQMLSKQPYELARKQLSLAATEKKEEYDEIMSLTNPVIKKKLLAEFADDCDKAAVDLKAAAFPRQASRVILPVNSLKDNEVFAPTFDDGEEVILIRYPHGGIFEIPRLKVNNKNKEARESIGTGAIDAIGINHRVAEQLSGADFDGDSVLVIPTKGHKFDVMSPLEALKDFDDKAAYPERPGMKVMLEKQKGAHMGMISNLITDMTLKGATTDELARAVKHSMVVVDAPKHKLDYMRSYEENDISGLKKKYQPEGGVSTLISRAKSPYYVDQRDYKRPYDIDPKTGKKVWNYTGKKKKSATKGPDGKLIFEDTNDLKQQKSTRMYETEDARELSSGLPMENLYAAYANSMKTLGNMARKESLRVKKYGYSPTAHKTYKDEVDSLNDKLDKALKNAPLERKAQMAAGIYIKTKIQDDPSLADDEDQLKKVRQQTINNMRAKFGAKREPIKISDKEWEAIQAGAISATKLEAIINNSDPDVLRQLSMPKTQVELGSAKIATAKAMINAGYTIKEVADHYGVSPSTLTKYVKE